MTGRRKRLAFLVGLLALVLGTSLFALSRGGKRGVIQEGTQEPLTKPRVEMGRNKVVGYSPDGEAVFEAEMERAEYDREKGIARLWGVKCQLFEGGEAVSAVEAERFEFLLEENRGVFWGVNRAWSDKEGAEIWCEDLVWEVGEKRLHSDKPAKFQKGNVKMEGKRLDADLALRKVSLYDGATFVAEFKRGKG